MVQTHTASGSRARTRGALTVGLSLGVTLLFRPHRHCASRDSV